METTCKISLFGIQFRHLPGWRIVADSSYSMNFDSGLFRFEENVMEKKSRVSMGLRWEASQSTNETFLEEFRENIHREYRKAVKGKDREFEILQDEIVENPDGVKMSLIETQYRATQALFSRQKMQRLRVCNAAFYCEKTHRMIICSLVTTPQYMEENRELLMDLLCSIQTEEVYTPEEEAQRMEARAKRREVAAQQKKSPLAVLRARKQKDPPEDEQTGSDQEDQTEEEDPLDGQD